MVAPELTDGVVALIVQNKKATLWEINEKYSLEEVIQLYELCIIELYNKSLMMRK